MNGLTIWMNQELSKLKRDLDGLYDRMCRDYGMPTLMSGAGAVEVSETGDSVTIKAALPDVDPNDLELSITDDVLTITGRSAGTSEDEEREVKHRGSYSSRLKLPCKIEVDQIRAIYKEGILEVTLPKCPPPQSRRLKITS